jgi:hypothetical protein
MRQSGRDPAATPPRTQTWGVRATGPGRPTPAPLLLANAWGVHATNRPRPPPRVDKDQLTRGVRATAPSRPTPTPLSFANAWGACDKPAVTRPDTPSHSNAGCARNSARPRSPTSPRTQTWGACNSAQPRPPPRRPLALKRGVCVQQRPPAITHAPSTQTWGACNSAQPRPPSPTPPRTQTRGVRAAAPARDHPCPLARKRGGACNSVRPRPPTPDAPSHANAGGACMSACPRPHPGTPSHANVWGVFVIFCVPYSYSSSYLVSVLSLSLGPSCTQLKHEISTLFLSVHKSRGLGQAKPRPSPE